MSRSSSFIASVTGAVAILAFLPRDASAQRGGDPSGVRPAPSAACTGAFDSTDSADVQLYWLLQPSAVSKEEIGEEHRLQHARILQELRVLYSHPSSPEIIATPELIFRRWEQELLELGDEAPVGRGHPVISALIEFTLHRDGRIEDVELFGGWAAPALLLAMASAVDSARDRRVLETLTDRAIPEGGGGRRGVRFRLVLHDSPDYDLAHLPVGSVRVPAFSMRSLAVNRVVQPRYPRGLVAEDDMLAYMVVDARGRPEPASFRLLRGSYRSLADATRRALLQWEFAPAHIDDCPVRQEVLIPVSFRR